MARIAEAKVADLDFKLSQAEKRLAEALQGQRDAARKSDEAYSAFQSHEARSKALEQTALENERRVVDWERQLTDADRALTVTETRVQVHSPLHLPLSVLVLAANCTQSLLTRTIEQCIAVVS